MESLISRRHHDACRYVAAGACRRRDLETLLRISTGIEDGEDLIADTENGFRAANKG
ncbi:PLP-dependent transferase [Salmonella sp. WGH-01]|nr:PLP-dependent transferase [Salmonella sp. WGH-01]